VLAKGRKWFASNPDAGVTAASVAVTGVSVGRDEFDSRFATWSLANLDGSHQHLNPASHVDSYDKTRAWANG